MLYTCRTAIDAMHSFDSPHRHTGPQLRDKFLCSSSSFLLVLYLGGGSLYDEPRCVFRPSSISIYVACRVIQASQCHWVDGSLSTKCDHLWGLDYDTATLTLIVIRTESGPFKCIYAQRGDPPQYLKGRILNSNWTYRGQMEFM